MALTPPVPIPTGQRIKWCFPTNVVYGPIDTGPPVTGAATATLTFGEVAQTAGDPLGHNAWTAVWFDFDFSLPDGATIEAVYPVIQDLEVDCANVFAFANVGNSTYGYLSPGTPTLGGQKLVYTTPNFSGQATSAAAMPMPFDLASEIGIQTYQSAGGGGFTDTITATRPCFAVYYSGGTGGSALSQVPYTSLLTSGPENPDKCLYNDRNERKIGSLTIDWTQYPVLGNGTSPGGCEDFSFPEYTYVGAAATAIGATVYGYQLAELDLKTAFNGIGLDEVRAFYAQVRPSWGVMDDSGQQLGPSEFGGVVGSSTPIGPMYLTAATTSQSVALVPSGLAAQAENGVFGELDMIVPFYLIGPDLKVRVLNILQGWDATTGAPVVQGKVVFNFYNFDAQPYAGPGAVIAAV